MALRATVICLSIGSIEGQLQSLLSSPGGPSEAGLYISPLNYNHTLLGPAFSSPSNWYFAQWDAVQQMNASQWQPGNAACTSNDAVWYAQAVGQTICMEASKSSYALYISQNGSHMPCDVETDAFLSPTDNAYNNVRLNLPGNASLAIMKQLVASFDIDLLQFSTTPRCGPAGACGEPLDYAYLTLGLVLSAGKQTIFYQVILSDTRTAPSCPANDPCKTTNPFAYWFFDTMPTLGLSESISLLPGQSCLRPGTGPQHYSLSIYDRITAAVAFAAGRFGSDPDLSHWMITGLYLGPGLQGSAVTAVRISGFDLLYEPA